MNPLLDFCETLLDSLEKTATQLDLEIQRNAQLSQQLDAKSKLAAAPAIVPTVDQSLFLKLAHRLESEGLLLENMTVDSAAKAMAESPNLLAKLAFSLLTPITEGEVLDAPTPSTVTKEANVIDFQGRKLVDKDNWLAAIS